MLIHAIAKDLTKLVGSFIILKKEVFPGRTPINRVAKVISVVDMIHTLGSLYLEVEIVYGVSRHTIHPNDILGFYEKEVDVPYTKDTQEIECVKDGAIYRASFLHKECFNDAWGLSPAMVHEYIHTVLNANIILVAPNEEPEVEKRTSEVVRKEINELKEQLDELEKVKANAEIERKLNVVDRILLECQTIADDHGISFYYSAAADGVSGSYNHRFDRMEVSFK